AIQDISLVWFASPCSQRWDSRSRGNKRNDLPRLVADHVAGAAHRMQQRLREALIDFGTQPRNVHVDHIGLRVEVIIPDVLQQHGPSDDLAGVPHQIFEQAEFARLQLQLLPGAAYLMRKPIELEIADAIDGLLAAAASPARKRLDARQ